MKYKDSENKEKLERIKVVCIVLLSVVIIINLIIGIVSVKNGGKFGFYSLRFFIMSYDSEETNTNSGDLVIANKTSVKNLKENDVIIYRKNKIMLIKKIEKIDNDGKDIYINVANMNSENNNGKKYERADTKEIMGKVILKNKGMGNMAVFIKSPLGKINLVLIVLCIFIISKRMIDKKKEDKLVDSCSDDKSDDNVEVEIRQEKNELSKSNNDVLQDKR